MIKSLITPPYTRSLPELQAELAKKDQADYSNAPGRDSNKEALYNLGLISEQGIGQVFPPNVG